MNVTLPYPPAASLSPRSREARRRYAVRCEPLLAGAVPMCGDVYVAVRFYPRASHTGDIDNMLKTLFDVLQSHCFYDDKQIKAAYIRVMPPDPSNPRVEVMAAPHRIKEEVIPPKMG